MGNAKTVSAGSSGSMAGDAVLRLSDQARDQIVATKATCPFLGSAVHQGQLPVRGEAGNPLARIEDVRQLGNSGGGDLGDLLAIFASGNHAFMRGSSGKLDIPAPAGLFSLELPGSQGSHPGHSGILQGDPAVPGSGRLSEADFERLAKRARNGLIARSDVGRFIAENLARDPQSKVLDLDVAKRLADDAGALLKTLLPALSAKLQGTAREVAATHRDVEEKLTKLAGENNLVGSAGEFGLLFAFLDNKPSAQELDSEPAVELLDVRAMFLDKHLPDGWENWPKRRIDWVKHTTGLLLSAAKEYRALKR
jgi:hypothetical protein